MVHLIFWNPDISSMTRERMTDEMSEIIFNGGMFNWSFWEHENVKPGDTCYMVRCGDHTGPHGVMLRAKIISKPYVDEDWSGRGRKIYYADWFPQEFIDTEYENPLSVDVLEQLMPEVNWRGGHSGRELQPDYESILEKAWYDCLRELIPTIPEGLMVNPRANELTSQTLDFWKILITSRS